MRCGIFFFFFNRVEQGKKIHQRFQLEFQCFPFGNANLKNCLTPHLLSAQHSEYTRYTDKFVSLLYGRVAFASINKYDTTKTTRNGQNENAFDGRTNRIDAIVRSRCVNFRLDSSRTVTDGGKITSELSRSRGNSRDQFLLKWIWN